MEEEAFRQTLTELEAPIRVIVAKAISQKSEIQSEPEQTAELQELSACLDKWTRHISPRFMAFVRRRAGAEKAEDIAQTLLTRLCEDLYDYLGCPHDHDKIKLRLEPTTSLYAALCGWVGHEWALKSPRLDDIKRAKQDPESRADSLGKPTLQRTPQKPLRALNKTRGAVGNAVANEQRYRSMIEADYKHRIASRVTTSIEAYYKPRAASRVLVEEHVEAQPDLELFLQSFLTVLAHRSPQKCLLFMLYYLPFPQSLKEMEKCASQAGYAAKAAKACAKQFAAVLQVHKLGGEITQGHLGMIVGVHRTTISQWDDELKDLCYLYLGVKREKGKSGYRTSGGI